MSEGRWAAVGGTAHYWKFVPDGTGLSECALRIGALPAETDPFKHSLCVTCARSAGLKIPVRRSPRRRGRVSAHACRDERYGDPRPFRSELEREFYYALKLREAAGEVFEVRRETDPACHYPIVVNGVRVYDYHADFAYKERVVLDRLTDGRPFVVQDEARLVDVKGYETKPEVFRLVAKLLKAVYDVDLLVWTKGAAAPYPVLARAPKGSKGGGVKANGKRKARRGGVGHKAA